MNTRDRIHNLELIYEVCCAEMKKLQTTITEFLEESSMTLQVIRSKLELDKTDKGVDVYSLIAYDEYLTKLSTTTEMTRKFNLHLYFQGKQQNLDIENVCSQVNALNFTCGDEEESPSPAPQLALGHEQEHEHENEPEHDPEPEALFLYEKASIDHFEVHSVIDACVVYVDRQSLSLNFSICEIRNPLITALLHLQVTLNGNCSKFDRIPDPNEVFGLVIENQLFRAVRENTREIREKYLAHLLEFGEVTEINSLSEMYHLPEKYRDIPAQAVQCELVSVNGNSNYDLRRALLKYECTKARFTLVRKDDSILYMNLVENEDVPVVRQPSETNPFKSNGYVQEEEPAEVPSKTNGFSQVEPSSSHPQGAEGITFKNTGYPDEQAALAGSNGLTQAELDELYEEPVQTTNAMKAVMGYIPKDEARICKFYNPVTKSCFKGSNCKMEHTAIMQDGWTKDTETVLIDVCVPMAYPKDGTVLRVIPTHIVDVCTFYAQMEFSERNDNPLFWSSREIPDKTKLKRPPFQFDMVLAQFTDGNWYRAQVMDSFEDNTFRVFYVDYGNEDIVPLSCLAEWNKNLSSYSFQAFRCRIVGIANATRNKVDEDNALKIIGGMILDQFVSVRVLHSTDEMLVEFIDKNCAKLPDILIWQRFATQVEQIL
ncbi:uncharacterized protein LOC129949801 [Eupeodes corollae]|uniref:uncharacterized protein LOC129949801 n=1 Tax=Eupeodes corollae TaxID=290404 RepID=UPI002491109F|nr:uncharacterized protein LOC129949801 [Eupeodes corollae]